MIVQNFIIIIIIIIFGCVYHQNKIPLFYGFRNPTPVEKTFTHYIDSYDRKKHKYPFWGYSLYGLDDHPRLLNRKPNRSQNSYFNQTTLPLRYSGHTKGLGGIDYTGLPSSFHVRQRTN